MAIRAQGYAIIKKNFMGLDEYAPGMKKRCRVSR